MLRTHPEPAYTWQFHQSGDKRARNSALNSLHQTDSCLQEAPESPLDTFYRLFSSAQYALKDRAFDRVQRLQSHYSCGNCSRVPHADTTVRFHGIA